MSEGPGGPQGATAGGTLAMRMLSQQAMVASQMKRAANDKAIAQMLASKKSGPPAARLGDEIQHKSFLGALAGAVLGTIVTIAEGCLIMAACATGPYALVLVPALMYASYKASDYVEEKQNQLESWINSFCDTDGAINTGSENVKINGELAARAAVTLPPPPPPGAIPEVPQGEPSWGDIATDLLESAAEKAVPLAKAWGNAVITLTDSNAGFMDRVSAGASLLFPAGPVLMEFATMVGGRGEIKKEVDFPEAGEDTALCDKENKPPRISVLRLFWGNLINFMANWRALKQVLQHGDPRRVAWDKTTHDFPSVTGDTRSLRPLGQILLENQVITEEQLDTALRNRVEGLRLGGSMLMQGLISAEQLAQALAEQNGVAWESIDAWQIPSSLIAEMPASVALHYAVLPLRLENDELIVGSEDGIDPVSLAALTRKVGRKVRYVIVLRGQIVTGLRHWYARRRGHDPRAMLYNAVQHQWLTEQQTGEIWRQYVPHQFLFAEILTTLGHINRSAINVLLLRHERSSLPLGKFLVTEGVISQETLDRVLTIQRELQVSMQSLLLKAGLNTEQVAQLESENEGE
ncbi:hypothetical protein [Escherichia coli]|uniref:GspE/PulE/PilB domain-containing protein n=1 Tax=Escherichia coli TaxID=562 RepID=UPI0020352278|nr:hypothetical protein [Escherichia coli]